MENIINPVLHQPIRTCIMAYLLGRGKATFNDFKDELSVTDGNLLTHIRKLIDADYITVQKEVINHKKQSLYLPTETGTQAFHRYVRDLNGLLKLGLNL